MTVKTTLNHARTTLNQLTDEANLEGELLLMHSLGIDRAQLYTNLEQAMTPRQEDTFWKLVTRRLSGEPTSYILGRREFYGLDYYVDPRVLIPRPESELLVEKSLEFARGHTVSTIADIGTGCGAIAISLALNLPEVEVYATDISTDALRVAAVNCRRHGVTHRIKLIRGNLLQALPEAVDLIVANLPYVTGSTLSHPPTFEPRLALDGGEDGLDKIRPLCHQAGNRLHPGGRLLLEIGQGQAAAVASLLHGLYPLAAITLTADLGGIERVVSLSLPPSETIRGKLDDKQP